MGHNDDDDDADDDDVRVERQFPLPHFPRGEPRPVTAATDPLTFH